MQDGECSRYCADNMLLGCEVWKCVVHSLCTFIVYIYCAGTFIVYAGAHCASTTLAMSRYVTAVTTITNVTAYGLILRRMGFLHVRTHVCVHVCTHRYYNCSCTYFTHANKLCALSHTYCIHMRSSHTFNYPAASPSKVQTLFSCFDFPCIS